MCQPNSCLYPIATKMVCPTSFDLPNNVSITKPINPLISISGEERTLADLLKFAYPEASKIEKFFSRVLVQGITPSPETPFRWLVENLSHPDQFLHICIQEDN